MLEEGETSTEIKRLRTDLTTMISCIEVSLKEILLLCPLMIAIFLTPCSLQNVMKVSEQCRWQLEEMASVLEENKSLQVSWKTSRHGYSKNTTSDKIWR